MGFGGGYCDYGDGCWPVLCLVCLVEAGFVWGRGWVFFLGAMARFVWCRGGLVVVVWVVGNLVVVWVVGWMRFL